MFWLVDWGARGEPAYTRHYERREECLQAFDRVRVQGRGFLGMYDEGKKLCVLIMARSE
jgi:hypothetical protein